MKIEHTCMDKKPSLILFTESFPFYSSKSVSEVSFLQNEIKFLSKKFSLVIIVPNKILEEQMTLPKNVTVEKGYAIGREFLSFRDHFFNLICNKFLYQEIILHPLILIKIHPMKDVLRRLLYGIYTCEWSKNLIEKYYLNTKKTIIYTYWFGNITFGNALLKEKYFPDLTLITRAHRSDLYHYVRENKFFAFREATMKYLNNIYLISEHGRNYFLSQYPWANKICKISKLGVVNPNHITNGSADGIFRIVSCSTLTPVKRVDLTIEALTKLASERKERFFEWHHFGDGETMSKCMELSKTRFPNNIYWKFHGNISNKEVLDFYTSNSVDLFINLSKSEGIPVAIMEAISVGIPIIATSVGGNPEIVKNNGILLSPNPTVSQIVDSIVEILDNLEKSDEFRKNSLRIWQQTYNADTNFLDFTNDLANRFNN